MAMALLWFELAISKWQGKSFSGAPPRSQNYNILITFKSWREHKDKLFLRFIYYPNFVHRLNQNFEKMKSFLEIDNCRTFFYTQYADNILNQNTLDSYCTMVSLVHGYCKVSEVQSVD